MINIGATGIIQEVLESFTSGVKNIAVGNIEDREREILLAQGYIIEDNATMGSFICKDETALDILKDSRIYKEYFSKEEAQKPVWFIKDLGLILGYPPEAVKVFDDINTDWSSPIMVNYCGLIFRSFENTLAEDIHWLFKNKPVEEKHFSLMISFEAEYTNLVSDLYKYSLLRVKYGTSLEKIDEMLEEILLTK